MEADITGARVLLVEQDPSVRLALADALAAQGFVVDAMADGEGLEQALRAAPPDLAVLEVRRTGRSDGFDIARRLRNGSDVPVVFLSAGDSLEHRLRGFELGCDDYVLKPFAVPELVARVRAVLRRSGVSVRAQVGDLTIDAGRRVAWRGRAELALTPTEFDLLLELARRPGVVRRKPELVNAVWGYSDHAPHLVEVHISTLRKKLERHGQRIILTARGGYLLSED